MDVNPETVELKEGEELEDVQKRVVAADPFEPRLKLITFDKACKGNYPAWILRSYGDKATYKAANPMHGSMQYGVVVVKSTVWPGAMSYFWRGQWGDIYVGDGHKHEDKVYFPINPPVICMDPEELLVQPEVSSFSTLINLFCSQIQTTRSMLTMLGLGESSRSWMRSGRITMPTTMATLIEMRPLNLHVRPC